MSNSIPWKYFRHWEEATPEPFNLGWLDLTFPNDFVTKRGAAFHDTTRLIYEKIRESKGSGLRADFYSAPLGNLLGDDTIRKPLVSGIITDVYRNQISKLMDLLIAVKNKEPYEKNGITHDIYSRIPPNEWDTFIYQAEERAEIIVIEWLKPSLVTYFQGNSMQASYDTHRAYAEEKYEYFKNTNYFETDTNWIADQLTTLIKKHTPPPPPPPAVYTEVVHHPSTENTAPVRIVPGNFTEAAFKEKDPGSPKITIQFDLRNVDPTLNPNTKELEILRNYYTELVDENKIEYQGIIERMRVKARGIREDRGEFKKTYGEASTTEERYSPTGQKDSSQPGGYRLRSIKKEVTNNLAISPSVFAAASSAKGLAYPMATIPPNGTLTQATKDINFQYVMIDPNNASKIISGLVSASKSSLPSFPAQTTTTRTVTDVLYSPTLTPSDIAALTDAIDYKSTLSQCRISSNFYIYLKPRVLKSNVVPDPNLTSNLNLYMYPVYNQPRADQVYFDDQDEFVELISVNPADTFYILSGTSSYTTWAEYDANYNAIISGGNVPYWPVTTQSTLITSSILNAPNPANQWDGTGYADGIIRPVSYLTPSGVKVVFTKLNAGTNLRSYQVVNIVPKLLW